MLGIGYGLRFSCLFRFLKSLIKLIQFYLGLGCAEYAAYHYELLAISRTPIITKH